MNELTKSKLVKIGTDLVVLSMSYESPFDEMGLLKEHVAQYHGECDRVVFDMLATNGNCASRLMQAVIKEDGFNAAAITTIPKGTERRLQLEITNNIAYVTHFPEALDSPIISKPTRYKLKHPFSVPFEHIITEDVARQMISSVF